MVVYLDKEKLVLECVEDLFFKMILVEKCG